jgi:4-hydroxybenzoyl-CoA thioesterase
MFTKKRHVRIEWGDCDPAGIVYFPRYFEFFNDATIALFEAVGLRKRELLQRYDIAGFAVVDARAKFRMPLTYGDDCEIESSIGNWGRSSFEVHHRLTKHSELAAEGFETRVWVGRDPDSPHGLKAHVIPKDLIELFEKK